MYGEEGGFVAFLDGHVRFFNNVVDEATQMVGFYTSDCTPRLPNALNHGAKAVGNGGIEWENK